MRPLKVFSIAALIVILTSNIYPVNSWIDSFADENYYAYSNGDGTNTHIYNAFKGGAFYVPHFLSTVALDPNKPPMDTTGGLFELPPGKLLHQFYPGADTIMYRLFWKNPFSFWRWKDYFFGNEKYDYPYKKWEDIISKRTFKKPENPTFQEF